MNRSHSSAGEQLNAAQREAVHTLRGPLLVLAGAGTGKTRVITFRIATLIRSGVRPDRILAVTFTRKAAAEMKQRAMELLHRGRRRTANAAVPEISTFHSLCVRILRRHLMQLGYPRNFVIYDRGDQESIARAALRDLHIGQERLRPGDFLSLVGAWKSAAKSPEEAESSAESDREQLAALAYHRYQTTLKAKGAVDFDDLLLRTLDLFEQLPRIRKLEAARYDHILIDEYQDTNAPQYRIVRALAERHRNLCVVGDDDQSIYGWRGAEVAHILDFARDWPEAKVVKLEQNYRSRRPILELANQLIKNNHDRHEKQLRAARFGGQAPRFLCFDDDAIEAQELVKDIARRLHDPGARRVRPREVAILFRTNEQPRAFELCLRREHIPYVLIGGLSFYDRKEVRDVLAYLRVIANPADEASLLRIINTPPRGIGNGTVQHLLDQAVEQGVPLWQALPRGPSPAGLPPGVADRVRGFVSLIESHRTGSEHQPSLAERARDLVRTIDYRAELVRQYRSDTEVEARLNAVEEVINALAQYEATAKQPTWSGFLDEATLDDAGPSSGQQSKEPEDAVTLMTLHSAKGLEFPHVYLVGMEEGLLPHRRSLADGGHSLSEERRLCYVGVTRARETLTLTLAKHRMKWGKPQPTLPSRFLFEMRGESARAQRVEEAVAARLAPPSKDSKRSSRKAKPGKRTPARTAPAKSPAGKQPTGHPATDRQPATPSTADAPSTSTVPRASRPAGADPKAHAKAMPHPKPAAKATRKRTDNQERTAKPRAAGPNPKPRAAKPKALAAQRTTSAPSARRRTTTKSAAQQSTNRRRVKRKSAPTALPASKQPPTRPRTRG